MNFVVKDNNISFGFSSDLLEFKLKGNDADFTIDTDSENFTVDEGKKTDFTPDLVYMTGTSPIPAYTGPYVVTPKTSQQMLNTAGYRMTENVTINQITYAETSNVYGTTAWIGEE